MDSSEDVLRNIYNATQQYLRSHTIIHPEPVACTPSATATQCTVTRKPSHVCTNECEFFVNRDVYICQASGNVHVCTADQCVTLVATKENKICTITARAFDLDPVVYTRVIFRYKDSGDTSVVVDDNGPPVTDSAAKDDGYGDGAFGDASEHAPGSFDVLSNSYEIPRDQVPDLAPDPSTTTVNKAVKIELPEHLREGPLRLTDTRDPNDDTPRKPLAILPSFRKAGDVLDWNEPGSLSSHRQLSESATSTTRAVVFARSSSSVCYGSIVDESYSRSPLSSACSVNDTSLARVTESSGSNVPLTEHGVALRPLDVHCFARSRKRVRDQSGKETETVLVKLESKDEEEHRTSNGASSSNNHCLHRKNATQKRRTLACRSKRRVVTANSEYEGFIRFLLNYQRAHVRGNSVASSSVLNNSLADTDVQWLAKLCSDVWHLVSQARSFDATYRPLYHVLVVLSNLTNSLKIRDKVIIPSMPAEFVRNIPSVFSLKSVKYDGTSIVVSWYTGASKKLIEYCSEVSGDAIDAYIETRNGLKRRQLSRLSEQ